MRKLTILVAAIMALAMMSNALAFGVVTPYLNDSTMIMHPGESKDMQLTLQNMVGDKDLRIKAEMTSGSEIASISDSLTEYAVPANTKDTPVNVHIEIPSNETLGTRHALAFTFTELTPESNGGVSMGMALDASFSVLVTQSMENPAPALTAAQTIMLIIAAIVILIVIWWLFEKRKRDWR